LIKDRQGVCDGPHLAAGILDGRKKLRALGIRKMLEKKAATRNINVYCKRNPPRLEIKEKGEKPLVRELSSKGESTIGGSLGKRADERKGKMKGKTFLK